MSKINKLVWLGLYIAGILIIVFALIAIFDIFDRPGAIGK